MHLVTGATGLIGRPLVETLLAEGAAVRAVTRDPHNAGLPAGVEAVAPELQRLAAGQIVEKVVAVRKILDRPARTFATWVTDHEGAWS
jgi:uncharacterized protein YbjT (DUF2867 family)